MGMGLIGKVIGGALAAKALRSAMASKTVATPRGQYIPAGSASTASGTSVLDKAGNFYRENPKLVHAVGSAALAILLAKLAQQQRR